MELSRRDTSILKGIAILLMVLLHLFARKDIEGLYVDIMIKDVPLSYYIGIMGDACRQVYLFVTGYAFYKVMSTSMESRWGKNIRRILKLYVNLWVVCLIFLPIGALYSSHYSFDDMSLSTLVPNLLGLENNYNGAWWFFKVYLLFVLLSPLIIPAIKRINSFVLICATGVIFLSAHMQRYMGIVDVGDNPMIVKTSMFIVLFLSCLFSFCVGAVFAKEPFVMDTLARIKRFRFNNLAAVLALVCITIFHSIVESSVVAPINGVVMVCAYLIMDKSVRVEKFLSYMSQHSTNIWLTHMFFYLTIFPALSFAPKYPPFIFVWVVGLCVATSYLIRLVTNYLFPLIDKIEMPSLRNKLIANATNERR